MHHITYVDNNDLTEIVQVLNDDLITHRFLLTPNLKRFIHGNNPSDKSLIEFAIADTQYAVNPDFTSNAINEINALYYSQSEFAFEQSVGLASIYNVSKPLISTIANIFEKYGGNESRLRVLELAIGEKNSAWKIIAQHMPDREIYLLATDISDPLERYPDKNPLTNLTIQTSELNLFTEDSIEKLDFNPDIVFTSYGFDSLWLPQDIHLIKDRKNNWYKKVFRIKVNPDTANQADMINALSSGNYEKELTLAHFKSVFVEEISIPIDIESLEYAKSIVEKYEVFESVEGLNFPGGLIRTIELLSKKVSNGGAIIIGDVAMHETNPDLVIRTNEKSGKVGRYKVEDYDLAAKILKEKGFKTEIVNVFLATGASTPNNCLLIIQK